MGVYRRRRSSGLLFAFLFLAMLGSFAAGDWVAGAVLLVGCAWVAA